MRNPHLGDLDQLATGLDVHSGSRALVDQSGDQSDRITEQMNRRQTCTYGGRIGVHPQLRTGPSMDKRGLRPTRPASSCRRAADATLDPDCAWRRLSTGAPSIDHCTLAILLTMNDLFDAKWGVRKGGLGPRVSPSPRRQRPLKVPRSVRWDWAGTPSVPLDLRIGWLQRVRCRAGQAPGQA